ncbi:tryptophan halogenase family protein [Sphingomonas sp. HF-S4]|uniref:Tryptophan halogenase family protein n=1 Tax=Sphingomonas agrestis TaxID=3080540 RepID=A0ABU3Y9W6_9SPHN|nr:tryptophan halogenase family protein [Sphingomonas sp. HF-S4]MDV3458161.1 tryptophan halogenase family protein [Sphingomonas sp. HF-S4]
MASEPYRIVVVGGGTAGWMTAAALVRFLGPGFAVTLVESDEIGTIGVGEATIPQIRMFNAGLGIDEDAFIAATQASFKLGIEFVGWTKGARYMHAFGEVGRPNGGVPFQHSWLRGRGEGVAQPLAAYALNNAAALANRMQRGLARTAAMLPEMPYAFHFDAGLYARFLRDYAVARGVVRHEGRIIEVLRDGESGDLTALRIDGEREIAGDLFIDCTGFRALLIGETLGVDYADWSHWLPCDRAMAVPSARAEDFTPYTRATAHAAGWQWRIPLQHRTGNGLVYASAHLSDDEAAGRLLANLDGPALADPRPLRFTTGKRRAFWQANVIAVGLSSGFLEPLESTSIHLIQSGIERILKLLPGRRITDAQRAEYDRQAHQEIDRIRDFLILHYWANDRDEPFWRARRETPLPEGLAQKIDLWRACGQIVREEADLFSEVAWLQVLAGQGIVAEGYHPLADQPLRADLAEYLDLLAKLIAREVAQMPDHAAFIRQHCAAREEIAA